jgi:hypothetical protein
VLNSKAPPKKHTLFTHRKYPKSSFHTLFVLYLIGHMKPSLTTTTTTTKKVAHNVLCESVPELNNISSKCFNQLGTSRALCVQVGNFRDYRCERVRQNFKTITPPPAHTHTAQCFYVRKSGSAVDGVRP